MARQMYALVENRPDSRAFGQPFYIGIGDMARPREHFTEARKYRHYNADMQKVIERHFLCNVEPIVQTLVIGSSAYIADLEKKAIALYGRRGVSHERGPLCNVTSGGDGPPGELMNSPEMRAKMAASLRASRAKDPARAEADRIRMTARMAAVAANPELSAQRSEDLSRAVKACWADPEHRAMRISKMRGVKKTSTPAWRAARAKAVAAMQAAKAEKKALLAKAEAESFSTRDAATQRTAV